MERRSDPRTLHLAGEIQARIWPGREVRVLDLSAGGALVEGDARLMPGRRVALQIVSADRRVLVTFDGQQAGCKVSYRLRWVSTRGDKGPWRETIQASVAA